MATHPLQTIGQAVGATGGDPPPVQLSSLFQGANDGPAKTAAKLTGVHGPGKRADDGPYFTNNEALPFPDPAHSRWDSNPIPEIGINKKACESQIAGGLMY